MQKTTLIIDAIITPYIIARYNAINKQLHGNLMVLFQAKTEKNRSWKYFPKIEFNYKFLDDVPVTLGVRDTHTFHINLEIISYLNQHQHEIERVILCGWDSLTYWYSTWFCHSRNIRLTLWAGSTKYEGSWRRTVFMPIILLLIRYSDDFIVYGTRAKDFLISLGAPRNNIKIFINSVDILYFSKKSAQLRKRKQYLRRKWGVSVTKKTFLYVGQLIERKGLYELLEAYLKVHLTLPNTQLLLVGNGQLYDDINQRYSEKYSNIKILKHVEYDLIPEIYALADIFVLPSKEEVWGLVVNEALASQLPVVVSDRVGASQDLVIQGKNGYTYRSGSILDLYKYLLSSLLNSNKLKKHTTSTIQITDPFKVAKKVFNGKK